MVHLDTGGNGTMVSMLWLPPHLAHANSWQSVNEYAGKLDLALSGGFRQ